MKTPMSGIGGTLYFKASQDRPGLSRLICPSHPAGEQASCIQYYMEGRIDGVIFISSAHSEQNFMESDYIEMFQRHAIPFVVIYGYTNEPGVSYIKSDMYRDGLAACHLLLENGCSGLDTSAPSARTT